MKRRLACILLLVFWVSMFLVACTPAQQTSSTTEPTTEPTTQAPRPSYAGTMEGYEYFHTNERDRAWEEDVLFVAEACLTGHPLLADKKFYTYATIVEDGKMKSETTYDNSYYSQQRRLEFIDRANWLIRNIPTLSDAEIVFETQKMIAILGDYCSFLLAHQVCTEKLPIFLGYLTTPDGYDFLIADVPAEREELLHTKLVSINGVAIEEIAARMAAYGSGQEDGQAIRDLAERSWLTRKEALQVVGVVGEADTTVELVVTTGREEITCTLPFVPNEEYGEWTWMDQSLFDRDIPCYRYVDERNYWYEVLDGDTMYVRFYSMNEDPNQSVNAFYTEITKTMRAAETPLNVIVDFRYNGGGTRGNMEALANIINQYSSGQVHILINERTCYGGVVVAYALSLLAEGAVLAGTPACHGCSMLSYAEVFEMPNCGYLFCVSNGYCKTEPDLETDTLMPDITIYQDWEDYRNGVDTVLEYVLAQMDDNQEAP